MRQNTNTQRTLKRAALMALVGLFTAPAAMAGDLSIGIRIGVPTPPPVVVVSERPVVFETFVVGYRRQLYDADLALRLARADEFTAYDELQAARGREADIAASMDQSDALIADLRRRVGDGAADADAIHRDVVAAGNRCGELRRLLDSYAHRINAGQEDLEASRIVSDVRGSDDARLRVRAYQDKLAAASAELHDTEGRLAHLKDMEVAASAFAADRARLRDAEARRAGVDHDLAVAHEAVFNTEHRWEDARERVAVASHDRDEALWLLHRDDIYAGRIDLASCGFNIDLSVWGGRLPRDPEVVHAYCVRDVAYIRANPIFIENRCTEVTRVTEVTKIREVTRVHDVERVRVVERVETTHNDDRRHYAEAVVTEHKRFEAEATERKTAAAEHRAPHVDSFVERKVDRANANAAVANHNAAVAKQDAGREAAKNAQQQKELDAQGRQIKREQAEINDLKKDQTKAATPAADAGDSRAARARRRADEAAAADKNGRAGKDQQVSSDR